MMSPVLSIIIPVYNVEKYLPACLDSVLAQEGLDFEVILVDDGSTDGSGIICDTYAARDSRVLVTHSSNGGVSRARNVGMSMAVGEWIEFVDSDDTLGENVFSAFSSVLKIQQHIDCIIFGYRVIRDGQKNDVVPPKGVYNNTNFGKEYLQLLPSFLINSPCNKLYRRDIINKVNACFPEHMSLGEDLVFNNQYLAGCTSFLLLDYPFYLYFQRDCFSLTTRYYPDLFDMYKCHYQSIRNTLIRFGLREDSPEFLIFFSKYPREAIFSLISPSCPLNLLGKYKKLCQIGADDITQCSIGYYPKQGIFEKSLKKHFFLLTFLYILAAKTKKILRQLFV